MSELLSFTRPRFTARVVAKVIGQKLGRDLAFHEGTN